MRSTLFRRKALKQQQTRLEGDVLLLQPLSQPMVVGVLLTLVVIFGTFLAHASFARQERVTGVLMPDKGILKVYSPQSGIVKKVLVEEGVNVELGQPLAIIGSSKVSTAGKETLAAHISVLQGQQALLQEQQDRVLHTIEHRTQQLSLDRKGIEQRLTHIEAQLETLELQQRLSAQQLSALDGLLKQKHITQVQHNEVHRQYLNLVAQRENLLQQQSQNHQHLINIDQQLSLLPTEQKNQLDQLKAQHYQLQRQLLDAQSNHQFVLRAEQAGVISSMQLHKGQHVSSQTPLLSVLPQHSTLQGELLVPSHAIGFIQPGQSVALKYTAFPFQKFGVYQGEVVEISKNVLIPNEWQHLPLHISQPSYRVTVQIDSQQVQAYGKSFSLQPGIQFDAHIRLDERSLLEWLLEPLLSLKGRFV